MSLAGPPDLGVGFREMGGLFGDAGRCPAEWWRGMILRLTLLVATSCASWGSSPPFLPRAWCPLPGSRQTKPEKAQGRHRSLDLRDAAVGVLAISDRSGNWSAPCWGQETWVSVNPFPPVVKCMIPQDRLTEKLFQPLWWVLCSEKIVPGSDAAETYCACFMREGLRVGSGSGGNPQGLLQNSASWGQRLWGDTLVGFSSLNCV